jgi:hypothetical protein
MVYYNQLAGRKAAVALFGVAMVGTLPLLLCSEQASRFPGGADGPLLMVSACPPPVMNQTYSNQLGLRAKRIQPSRELAAALRGPHPRERAPGGWLGCARGALRRRMP